MRRAPDLPFTPRNGVYPVVLIIGATSFEVRKTISNLETLGMQVKHWEIGADWGQYPAETDIVLLIRTSLKNELPRIRALITDPRTHVVETRPEWLTARHAMIGRGLIGTWKRPPDPAATPASGTPDDQASALADPAAATTAGLAAASAALKDALNDLARMPPALLLQFQKARWMGTARVAELLGIPVTAVLRIIDRNAKREGNSIISRADGFTARKFGGQWRIWLDPTWLDPAKDPGRKR